MGLSNIDPSDPIIQLEVTKVLLRTSEAKITQLEQVIARANRDIGQKDRELKQIRDEREDLRIKWEVLQTDFKHAQDTITKGTQKTSKKISSARFQAFLATLLFLITSVLVNFGTTMLTSKPPNSLGWALIGLAAAAYIIAALMTTLLALEGGSS